MRKLTTRTKVSSLAIAVALAAGPSPAAAQSILGSGSFTTNGGGAASITTGSGTTDIALNPGQTVIDWTPSDPTPGPIVIFQNSDTTATFSSSSDFAVLNRIDVADNSRAVFMNGNINSSVDGVAGQGSVFFYSPSGFVIGANASINVGSLVLSASPITVDPDTGDFIGGGFSPGDQVVEFGAQTDPFGNIPNPSATITTVAGSQVNALAGGSYVALVAPRVEHHGTINVDGSAALVGAEAATITFRTNGLFDIQVDTGTTDGNGVVVASEGVITGPAGNGFNDSHRAYLVAVPKNTAMTMLISSGAELGFDIAGAADVVGNAVVLSAGHDISFGDASGSASAASGADGNVTIENASFTSAVYGRANGDISATSVDGSLTFASDASLRGRGLAKLEAGGGGNISVAGELRLSANASGGSEGASAQAGNVTLQAFAGGQIDILGDTVLTATGSGGGSFTPGIAGGEGRGGTILVQATTGGDIRIGNSDNPSTLDANAGGFGGSFIGPVDGGNGYGGTVNVFASGGGTLTVAGATYLRAEGVGGLPNDCFTCGAIGGIGDGGTVNVQAHTGPGSILDFRDVLYIWANGQGGRGQIGGLGRGGDVSVSATSGGTATVASDVAIEANGLGGDSVGAGTAGAGIGGQNVRVYADGGTLTLQADLTVNVEGQGGVSEAGTGGSGTGGRGQIYVIGGGNVGISGVAELSTTGRGGQGITGGAGIGGATVNGGGATVSVNGGAISIAAGATVESNGVGGDAFPADGSGLDGGNGIGGLAEMFIGAVGGGTLTIGGLTTIDATGQGGASFDSNGGDGLGGTARYLGLGGAASFGDLVVQAIGRGGVSEGGTGGDGTGNSARISAVGGDVSTSGTASVSTQGFGGDGVSGGNGVGGGDYFDGMVGGAHLYAQNGGTIVVGGMAVAMADGLGGNGAAGGNGGDGTGGWASIHAANGTATSSITVQAVEASAQVSANGTGGNGGAGVTGTFGSSGATGGTGGTGGAGGNGGIGTGGVAAITAAAGNGVLNIDFGHVDANGTGGAGGAGGTGGTGGFGSNGPGGNGGTGGLGGTGGAAFGGLASAGSESGSSEAAGGNAGTANFVDVEITANATGGAGGSGGSGGAGGVGSPNGSVGTAGNGGAGGNASGGVAELQARGGTVNLTSALLTSNAAGGAGGSGATAGAGGNAESDEAYVLVTNRAGSPALRGRLNAGTITGVVTATGGTGQGGSGVSTMEGGSGFVVINGDATIGSVDFSVTADGQIPDLATDLIRIINADVDITNGFTFNTDGVASVYADNATLNAATFTVSASNFIHDPDLPAGPQAVGTIDADAFSLATGQDLIIDAHLDSGSSLNLTAPGLIDIRNATAATSIDLDAGSTIRFGDINADLLDFEAGGAVSGGNIIAGTAATGEAGGAVTLGNINVGILRSGGASEDGFAVGIAAEGPITVGNVAADESVGFATLGDLTTGNLNAGENVMTLVGGNTTIASILAPGRTYHGDVQMFIDAGGPDDFDPSLVLAQAPVRSGGSYTVTGAISTGQLQVGAASISTGDIFAFDGVTMDAAGSVLTGDIDAGSIDLFAGGNISTGYLNTQLISQLGDFTTLLFPGASITLESGGDISTGDISSIDGVYLNAGGGISTDDIDAFDFVEAHAGTSIAIGNIDAGSYVFLDAGTNLSAAAVNATDIEASAGGLATVGGAWNAEGDVGITSNDIDIASNGSISGSDISLTSINATQTVVGDGVAGGGYQLSDAEYDRLHSNDITVIADQGLGAVPRMLLGDLSVDGSDGEGFNDYEFITGDSETESAAGSIRILGDVLFSNMGGSSVGFTTGTFELDAATGLLSLENAPGVLGGELFLNAARIHVASGDILDQLAEDPQYEGYQEDLNAPAEVQRPDGVIRAASVDIEFGDAGEGQLNTLYVQNTGTADTPAGFLISDLSLGDDGEVVLPANSIDLIINGQIVTEAGTLTGIDVRDLLVQGRDLTPFTTNSTINGCLLIGACAQPEGPFPPGFTPTPGLPEEFELVDNNNLPPPDFGNEDFIDDNIETTAEGATSPIKPPQPLFDTAALGDKGDVDDPVSGSGNPALMETPAGKTVCPAGGSSTVPCKEDTQ